MTAAEYTAWREKIRRIAGYWARRWARYQDQRAVVEDLEAVGWLVLLRYGPEHRRLRWELQNAVQDAIALWLWGVTRGQRPRHGEIAWLSAEGLPDHHPGPLERVLALEQAARMTTHEYRRLEQRLWPRGGMDYRRRKSWSSRGNCPMRKTDRSGTAPFGSPAPAGPVVPSAA